jgi:hypothetical protein
VEVVGEIVCDVFDSVVFARAVAWFSLGILLGSFAEVVCSESSYLFKPAFGPSLAVIGRLPRATF